MHYGQYQRNMDTKNRIMLPAKLVETLGTTFYLTIGFDGIVEMRSIAEFNLLTADLVQKSAFDKNVRMLNRFILGNSQEISLDNQNRFVLPKQFLDKAAIQKEIIFVGAGNYVELWAQEKYDDYALSMNDEQIAQAAQLLVESSK